jgi:hypothetical protein
LKSEEEEGREERRGTVNKAGKIKAKDRHSKWEGGQEGREERRRKGKDTERGAGTRNRKGRKREDAEIEEKIGNKEN